MMGLGYELPERERLTANHRMNPSVSGWSAMMPHASARAAAHLGHSQ
jgi:hypothetical protein